MTNTTTIYRHDDFIVNKYHKWYFNIIIKAQVDNEYRKSDDRHKYQNHHIIPKSLGGSNSENNLVLMTHKEHYMAHLLLPKMLKLGSKSYISMVYAFQMMGTTKKDERYNSRLYETFKIKYFKHCRGKNHPYYGRTLSHKHKKKLSMANLGKKASNKTKQKMSVARSGKNNPMYGKKISKEHKNKMSNVNTGTKNHQFKGYYITPWGIFSSTTSASTECVTPRTIGTWCKEPNKVINRRSISKSEYLKSLNGSPYGKTFRDLGFSFESVR